MSTNLGWNFSPPSSRGSPSRANLVFDPFAVGPDHEFHYNSTSIVKLEESGNIFCPICLENISLNGIFRVSEELYYKYVENLFEALNQYSETDQLRRIILPILEIILKKRPLKIKSDDDFHHILHTIYKLMRSDKFCAKEFFSITCIFSVICGNFVDSNPLPLKSIRYASEQMLQFGQKNLLPRIQGLSAFEGEAIKIYSSLSAIINSYLKALNRFAVGQVSDLVFPLYEDDVFQIREKRYYKDSQIYCIDFMVSNMLIKFFSDIPKNKALDLDTTRMVGDFFDALTECLATSIRINYTGFLECLDNQDCILISHELVSKNHDPTFKAKIRSFLKVFVQFQTKLELESDPVSENFLSLEEIVETNHKNALQYCEHERKYTKVIFYILVNCIAIKKKSNYSNTTRMKKVIRKFNPDVIEYKESKVLLRSYVYVLAKVTSQVDSDKVIENYLVKIWQQIDDDLMFDEVFCFDEIVFYFSYQHPIFISRVTVESIKYLIEGSNRRGCLQQNLLHLLLHGTYKEIMTKYFIEGQQATTILVEAMDRKNIPSDSPQNHELLLKALTSELSAYLSSILYKALLDCANSNIDDGDDDYVATQNDDNDSDKCSEQLMTVTNIINILMGNCDEFVLSIDDQFIFDLFKLLETHYYNYLYHDGELDLIITLNEFITQLMITHHPSLIKVLYNLDFTVLGFMYHCIADYTKNDRLGESIARLLVAYDGIDYPLLHSVPLNLCKMSASIFNWMLSQNGDLHQLSLILTQRILNSPDETRTGRAFVTTGLTHMLYINPNIIKKKLNLKLFESALEHDELLYNPLLGRVLNFLPEKVRVDLDRRLRSYEYPTAPPSPAPTFLSSSSEADEDISFENIHINVVNVLNQLHEENNFTLPNLCSVPKYLFAAGSIGDQHVALPNLEQWEKIAYDTNREIDI